MTGAEADETVVVARAAWSALSEPGDPVAGALVQTIGAAAAWEWLDAVRGGGWVDPVRFAEPGGLDRPLGADQGSTMTGNDGVAPDGGLVRRRLTAALARWAPRWSPDLGERAVDRGRRLGATVLVPGTSSWPRGADDLGVHAPLCLWVRGEAALDRLLSGSLAVVGARACTSYGEHVGGDLVGDLAAGGVTVVSGGAYGIDAVAHRAALGSGGATVAVLAGGVDRLYPAGNARLLAAVAQGGGAVVAEVPPGAVPSRSRFLQRNRVIAALTSATVVVEAAWRSGALSTAGHAAALLRPVGAVPGPVTSAASAGCHRLLREGMAVCVTDAAEVRELLGGGLAGGAAGTAGRGHPSLDGGREAPRPYDDLDELGRRVLDALPVRHPADVSSLARTAGIAQADVMAALGGLEVRGLAERAARGWRCGPLLRAGGTSPDRSSG